MSDLSDRLAALISELGIKKTAFAERINVSQAFVSQLCSGVKQPSDRTIADICREFGVSEAWLRTGAGDMFIPRDPDQELQDALAEITVSDDPLIRRIILAYWGLDTEERAAVQKLIDGLIAEKEPPGD